MHDETSNAAASHSGASIAGASDAGASNPAAPDAPAKARPKTREQRLAEELRMNLRRRKAQARGRAQSAGGPAEDDADRA
jgi:hypothetical protein